MKKSKDNINYISVGETVACGACQPTKFADCREVFKGMNPPMECKCECHTLKPQDMTNEQKLEEEFDERMQKTFVRGGLMYILDYPPHVWMLDPDAVKAFIKENYIPRATVKEVLDKTFFSGDFPFKWEQDTLKEMDEGMQRVVATYTEAIVKAVQDAKKKLIK